MSRHNERMAAADTETQIHYSPQQGAGAPHGVPAAPAPLCARPPWSWLGFKAFPYCCSAPWGGGPLDRRSSGWRPLVRTPRFAGQALTGAKPLVPSSRRAAPRLGPDELRLNSLLRLQLHQSPVDPAPLRDEGWEQLPGVWAAKLMGRPGVSRPTLDKRESQGTCKLSASNFRHLRDGAP